jgi:DAK2 domain fusion protein YloV
LINHKMETDPNTSTQPQFVDADILEKPINGRSLKVLVEAGLTWLRTNQQLVNSLNVFPVPDGDTGTNIVLTMQSAYDEIANSNERNFGKVAHAVAHGALMGARGNSGVILSQLWRGFARAVDNQETLDASTLAVAMGSARDTAYKGVVRPVEGTILTVAKDAAAAAEQGLEITSNLANLLEIIVKAADISVQHTPELLPVLKEAGVVDAGGKGLFFIIEGMLRYARRQSLEISVPAIQTLQAMQLERTLEAIEPGQDVEVVIDFRPSSPIELQSFYQRLETMGTSIQVGEGDGIYRLHIHVPKEKRNEPIDYAMSLGVWTKISMENLVAQMEQIADTQSKGELSLTQVTPEQIGVVAVSPGAGIARIFASLGVAAIVEGGQTMNPSTQEIVDAFENLPTDQVIILPNNKNIILAAQAAAETTEKKIAVVPSRSIPQGLAAMLRLVPEGDFESVVEDMIDALDDVITGEITIATRSVEIDGVATQEGQVIGLLNGRLVVATSSLEESCLGLLEKADADQYELITLFYGSQISRQEADRIANMICQNYPRHEVEIKEGGQPHYHFIISIE